MPDAVLRTCHDHFNHAIAARRRRLEQLAQEVTEIAEDPQAHMLEVQMDLDANQVCSFSFDLSCFSLIGYSG